MPEELAPDVAQTSPEPEESSTPAIEQTVAADEQDSPPETAEPKRSRAEERIAGLVAEKAAAKEYGNHFREAYTDLEAKYRALQDQAPETVSDASQPTLEQFDHDTDKWAVAYSEWSKGQAKSVAEKAVAKAILNQRNVDEVEAKERVWVDRSSKFAETHPDFASVAGRRELPINAAMANIFKESEKGPEIAYHLGNNPDVAARISRMSAGKMAMALGRIESELTSKPQPTKAPAPPTPVGGQQPTVDLADMSIDEYMKHESARLYTIRK